MRSDDVFDEIEADAWFERNQGRLDPSRAAVSDPALKLLRDWRIRPRRALEIGASNGYRMQALRDECGCEASALDLSANAVADGRRRFPGLDIVEGRATALPFESDAFDCVVAFGVFCWTSQSDIFKSLMEADRVLSDDGHLLIGDFLPPQPQRIRYHHRKDADIYTYKWDFSAVFQAFPTYRLLSRQLVDHETFSLDATHPAHDRFAVTLLRKDLTGGFLTKDRPDA